MLPLVGSSDGAACECLPIWDSALESNMRQQNLRLNIKNESAAPSRSPPIAHPTDAPAIAPVETPELELVLAVLFALEL